ncbi:MAG TPA: copper amine oxidase N-terminal domain-containing protein, partial [Armatimonadota bacterium]|nr:copper amine oxidase N-terminal domain-containing protein [Armatimonadota bacterium]
VMTSIDQQAECAARMRQLSIALGRYMDEHGQRLPRAEEWVTAAKAYLQNPAAVSCPSAAGDVPSIAMNGQLSGLRGVDIAAPERTVLLFDSQPGVSVGTDESAMARRHNHLATVLLASGTVVTVDSTATLKWTPGATRPATPSGGVTRPTAIRNAVEYVVLRDIVEPLGGRVSWNAQTKTITAMLGGRTLDVTDGQSTAMLDGAPLPLAAPPVTIDGKLLVPASTVSRAFRLWMRWSDGQVTVSLGQD